MRRKKKNKFDLSSTAPNAQGYEEYNCLQDVHLKPYFTRISAKTKQIALSQEKSKIFIVEQEFNRVLKEKKVQEKDEEYLRKLRNKIKKQKEEQKQKKIKVKFIKEQREKIINIQKALNYSPKNKKN